MEMFEVSGPNVRRARAFRRCSKFEFESWRVAEVRSI